MTNYAAGETATRRTTALRNIGSNSRNGIYMTQGLLLPLTAVCSFSEGKYPIRYHEISVMQAGSADLTDLM